MKSKIKKELKVKIASNIYKLSLKNKLTYTFLENTIKEVWDWGYSKGHCDRVAIEKKGRTNE